MRDKSLYSALWSFTQQATFELAAKASQGPGVPFDVVSRSGGSSLYEYRPLTDQFVSMHRSILLNLPTYGLAEEAIDSVSGHTRYLKYCAWDSKEMASDSSSEAVILAFTTQLFTDQSQFDLTKDRFDQQYQKLEDLLYRDRSVVSTVVPLHGLKIESEEVMIAEGLSLKQADRVVDSSQIAPWQLETLEPADTVLIYSVEIPAGEAVPIAEARKRFQRMITVLSLFSKGRPTLAPVGYSQVDGGNWKGFSIAVSGAAGGYQYIKRAEEGDLRTFTRIVWRQADRKDSAAWALRRFALGCAMTNRLDALSEYLLGLRALLVKADEQSQSDELLIERVALLCAEDKYRDRVRGTVRRALRLERSLIGGRELRDIDSEELIEAVAEYLRALLSDIFCGHLERDLVAVADESVTELEQQIAA